MKKKRDFHFLLLLTILFATVGFGVACNHYSFSGNTLPPHIKTVGVPLFVDKTSEFGVRESLTDAVVDAFTQDNTLKIADPSAADALVRGTIQSVTDRANTYTRQEQVKTYRVIVTVTAEFFDVKKQKVLWKATFQEWGEYQHSGSTEERQKAIETALKRIAEDILNKSVAGW